MMSRRGLLTLALAGALLVPATVTAQEADGTGVDCSQFKAAAIVHFMGPYTQQLLDGAKAAAEECGAEITTAGPAAFDTQAEVALFQSLVDPHDLSLDVEYLVAVAVTELEQPALQAVPPHLELRAAIEPAAHLLCGKCGRKQYCPHQDGQEYSLHLILSQVDSIQVQPATCWQVSGLYGARF